MATADRIEREIVIRAPLDRVWPLVAEPGWWIGENDGDRSGQTRTRQGRLEIIADPRLGRFAVEVVALEPPRRAAFRWVFTGSGQAPRPGNATLVEFLLREDGGATRVRVIERGFQSLDPDLRRQFEDNAEGWAVELDLLRGRAEDDRIERDTLIHAPIERLWDLVAEAGWWISTGDGDRTGQVRRRDGAYEVLDDPGNGRHLFEVVAMQRPIRVVHRWIKGADGLSTLVEFVLTEAAGGTRLRVVESGIAALPGDRARYRHDHAEGWEIELEIAGRRAQ